jgi:hypothetical protein
MALAHRLLQDGLCLRRGFANVNVATQGDDAGALAISRAALVGAKSSGPPTVCDE